MIANAWKILWANAIIVVPGILCSIWFRAIDLLLPHGFAGASLIFTSSVVIVSLGLFGLGLIYTIAMAEAAWQTGAAKLEDGSIALERDGLNFFLVVVLLIPGAIATALVARITIGLIPLAYYFLTLYAPVAAVVGKRRAFAAIGESCRIARDRLARTATLGLFFAGLIIAVVVATSPLRAIPWLGPIATMALSQIAISFCVVVLVGEYLAVRPQEA